jgi:pilus assembly protein CpaF
MLRQAGVTLTDADRQRLVEGVVDDVLGYGPIDPLIRDPTVTEVMVNGPHLVYVEREGKLVETDVHFEDDAHVKQVIQRIVQPLGRRVDRSRPMVDARLPDGSRVNVIISPCALDGSVITIRKFPSKRLTIEDLIRLGTLSEQVAEFIRACVLARLNIVVSGGTGSGKTTLLNVLSSFIPSDERIVTIEDSAELQLHQRHVVRLETAPVEPDGTGQVTIHDLVINALRMRPDRIAAGNEHWSRWQPDDRACQYPPGRDQPVGDAGTDVRLRSAIEGSARSDCLGYGLDHSAGTDARWLAQNHARHRGAGDGG